MAVGAYSVLALTSLHHVYGALLYRTPFRLHAVAVAVVVALLVAAAHRWLLRRSGLPALLVFSAATLLFPVAGIGLFEGAYNHVAKNVLYFGGASEQLLIALFPPPAYELPNDLFFELTGILQVLPAAFTAHAFVRFYRQWRARA